MPDQGDFSPEEWDGSAWDDEWENRLYGPEVVPVKKGVIETRYRVMAYAVIFFMVAPLVIGWLWLIRWLWRATFG